MISSKLPNFYLIELENKSIFDDFFIRFSPEISEYTFTNLYMWRNYYKFRWKKMENGLILVSLADPTKIIAFPPIGSNIKELLTNLIDITNHSNTQQKILEIHRVPDRFILELKETDLSYSIEEDRGSWDYVYLSSDLKLLQGGNYATERRKFHKFSRDNNWEYKILNKDNISLCLDLQEEWCNLRQCSDEPSLNNEDLAVKDVFEHWDALKFTGGVLTIDGKVCGYSIGEKLNENTFVCHIEKADPNIFGCYQAINQLFAEHLAKNYDFINREQDLGVYTLRMAKERYHPVKMIKKSIVKIALK